MGGRRVSFVVVLSGPSAAAPASTSKALEPVGVCAHCFGPFEPIYDKDARRRSLVADIIALAMAHGVSHVVRLA